jgi:hypothetical protein
LALNDIRNANNLTPGSLNQILLEKGISLKNSEVMGGMTRRRRNKNKNTARKTKKQKGGFTYKNSSKRKSISSFLKRSSKRSSR